MAGYAALVRWARRPAEYCPACGTIFSSECRECTRPSLLSLLPDRALNLVAAATEPELALMRALGVEWLEGNWRTWPHCCNQGGCGMHREEPFCHCGTGGSGGPCPWCRAAGRIDGWVPNLRRAGDRG